MPTLPTTCREDGSSSNWDRYLEVLIRRGVPETMRPWNVRRVVGVLKAHRPASFARIDVAKRDQGGRAAGRYPEVDQLDGHKATLRGLMKKVIKNNI